MLGSDPTAMGGGMVLGNEGRRRTIALEQKAACRVAGALLAFAHAKVEEPMSCSVLKRMARYNETLRLDHWPLSTNTPKRCMEAKHEERIFGKLV